MKYRIFAIVLCFIQNYLFFYTKIGLNGHLVMNIFDCKYNVL